MAIKASQLVDTLVLMSENSSIDEAIIKLQKFLDRRGAGHYWLQIKRELESRISNDQNNSSSEVIVSDEATKEIMSNPQADNYKVDSDIIAGFKIQDNDTLVDASLSTQLTNLEKTLTN